MSPESIPFWAAVATGVLGIGAIVAKEVLQMVRSKVEGVRNDDVSLDPEEPAPEPIDLTIVSNLTQVIQSMEAQLARVARKQEESDKRMERVEAEIEVERSLKWTAIQHIRTLYSWIARQLPGADVPDVPEELAPHVVVPGKDQREGI